MFLNRIARALVAAAAVAGIVTSSASAQDPAAMQPAARSSLLPNHWKASLDSVPAAPLVLSDGWGRAITEQEIQDRMSGFSFKRAGMGLLIGLGAGIAASTRKDNADCSVYEPCTEREKFLKAAPFVGALVGLLAGSALGHMTRVEAVEQIRADRGGNFR